MDFLDRLKQEKQIRETSERDALRLKIIIQQIYEIHHIKDGEFLDKLEEFLKQQHE